MIPLPMRSYFRYVTRRAWDPSRAWCQIHNAQFAAAPVMVQHLVEGMTSTLPTMQTVTLIQPQTLATPTLFQVEYKTEEQSWLGLTTSHLRRWRYSILAESRDLDKR